MVKQVFESKKILDGDRKKVFF